MYRSNNMRTNIAADVLRTYVKHNEVVYQFCGELMEVSNDTEKENKENLLNHISQVVSVEIYDKDHCLIKDDFKELNNWSKVDDVFFLLQTIGVLICISRKDALNNGLIAA